MFCEVAEECGISLCQEFHKLIVDSHKVGAVVTIHAVDLSTDAQKTPQGVDEGVCGHVVQNLQVHCTTVHAGEAKAVPLQFGTSSFEMERTKTVNPNVGEGSGMFNPDCW